MRGRERKRKKEKERAKKENEKERILFQSSETQFQWKQIFSNIYFYILFIFYLLLFKFGLSSVLFVSNKC